MKLKLKQDIVKKFRAKSSKARSRIGSIFREELTEFGQTGVQLMLAAMRLPKTGKPYVREGGRIHIASAPGEAPAIDTGDLAASTKFLVKRVGTSRATRLLLGYGKNYGEELEMKMNRPNIIYQFDRIPIMIPNVMYKIVDFMNEPVN